MNENRVPRGPGLFELDAPAQGPRAITNIRRIAGNDREPGSVLIATAGALLAVLAGGLLAVSLAAQFQYVMHQRGQRVPSMIEAGALDAGMIIFSLLALGLARKGQPSRVERVLIMTCAAASAAMNFAAADVTSARSIAAYVMPPIFLAIVTDRVIAVVRRHVLGLEKDGSAWSSLAGLLRAMGRTLMYLLRFVLAPSSTATGMRRWVLIVTPLPAAPLPATSALSASAPAPALESAVTEPPELAGASKKARLSWWYRQDPAYGDRTATGAAARRLAPVVGLGEGTARAYIGAILADLEEEGQAS